MIDPCGTPQVANLLFSVTKSGSERFSLILKLEQT